jgi:hypothetical protein
MNEPGTSVLQLHAAWTLVATYLISLLYELWWATAKAGTSRHDALRVFLTQDLVLYVVAAFVIGRLFADAPGAGVVGLVFCVLGILLSILYYNPRIMLERQPGLVDWTEDLVYTGLLFVAATQLLYEVAGRALV